MFLCDFIDDIKNKIYMVYPFVEVTYRDSEESYLGYICVRFFYRGKQYGFNRCVNILHIDREKEYIAGLQHSFILEIQRAITNVILEGVENEF